MSFKLQDGPTYASYGCIRMHNHDIVDLFERVSVGTPVVVTR